MNVEVRELEAPERAVDREAIEEAGSEAYQARVRLYRADREIEAMRRALKLAEDNVLGPAQQKFGAAMGRLRKLLEQVGEDCDVTLQP